MEEGCNGKKLSGAHFARHAFEIHCNKAPNTL
jgi:hypothetical protein